MKEAGAGQGLFEQAFTPSVMWVCRIKYKSQLVPIFVNARKTLQIIGAHMRYAIAGLTLCHARTKLEQPFRRRSVFFFSIRMCQMKSRAIAWMAAAMCLPSAYAIDMNWDSHEATETLARNVAKNVTFMDDARYLLTPAQSGTTGVQATFQLNSGTIAGLKVDFYGDYYGPDKYLGSFAPGAGGLQTFSFEHITGRKKYYYLITGTTGTTGASYTLTSKLVPDSALHTAVAPVPEPSTYAMFALGAALLPLARRLRQRRVGSAEGAGPGLSAACAA